MSIGQQMRISSLPEFEGEAAIYEDFFCRLVGSEPSAHSLFSGAGTICHSPTGQSMEPAPGDADKIERLQFGCFFSSRKGRRNRTDSSNPRRPATDRVLERCYW